MALVFKSMVVMATMIALLGSQNQQTKKTEFVYLNNPETLKYTGILHQKKFTENTNVRYFFHYKNGTKDNQNFNIKTNFIVTNLKLAYDSNIRPEIAGANSCSAFMKTEPKNDVIKIKEILKPNETISGIIEGNFLKDEQVLISFGDNTKKLIAKDDIRNDYAHDFNFDICSKNSAKFRLGDDIKDTVDGQYGNDINLHINPKESGILKVSFSPRGGEGILVFENRGKVYHTKIKPAYKSYDVLYVSVEKNKKEDFKFIPLGGLNYPIELNFSLHSEISKDVII